MKKLFPIAFFSAALMFVACGDDSSSGPEEESSSSIEVEDESSSSVEEEGKSSAKEDGKSSAEEEDAKSSCSEAKKGDSSSSEKTTSSSSETVSSSSDPVSSSSVVLIPKFPYCKVGIEDGKVVLDFGAGMIQAKWSFDLDSKFREELEYVAPSCEEIENASNQNVYFDVYEDVCDISYCAVEGSVAKWSTKCTDSFLSYDDEEQIAKVLFSSCSEFLSSFSVVTTDYLNRQMLEDDVYGMLVDYRNLHIYRTIKIGNQTWMAQNLNNKPSSGSLCYDEDPYNCDKYGLLYTWEAAQNACPDGWGLPTKADFEKLIAQIKDNGYESVEKGESSFSGQEQLIAQSRGELGNTWNNVDGTDDFGFSALGAGHYVEEGEYGGLGDYTDFWAKADDENSAYIFELSKDSGEMLYIEDVKNSEDVKNAALSVRCIKDDAPSQSVSSN